MTNVIGMTGSTGVIGTAFAGFARESGYTVRPFSRPQLDLSAARLDARLFEGCDVIVHLAAHLPSGSAGEAEARACWEINAMGTIKLLEAMRKAGVGRLIQATAANAYAPWCEFPNEEAPLYPQSRTFYLSSKVMQELYAHAYGSELDVGVTSLRISSPYGPHPTRNTVGRMAAAMLAGEPVRLENGGTFGADFIFVRDIAKAILLLEASGETGVWNVASGTRRTILEIADMLARLTEATPSQLEVAPETKGSFEGYPAIDISKIRKLGFVPTDIETGLQATVEELRVAEIVPRAVIR